ncbi:hypothetical protein AKJ52_02085 [candidate division MSBL1 archaeon SCGC-AAA382C18]|uniref:Probable cobalamin biosynthesis protein CobD n=1 Tax=candidate division MSBL1 archaeon SCGC-AAA382C18 TaxID=1698281 RepID=A0A133VJD7_9EURY|nr:hypothetical protein AKJ52_02085 [candidate division MSBL1 archaeon SCGC-AAA382C18]
MSLINPSNSIYELIILSSAIIIDFLIGEFPEKIHPTVWIGKLANFLKSKLKGERGRVDIAGGVILTLLTFTIFVIPIYLLSILLVELYWIAYIFIMSLILMSTFAIRSMENHILRIITAIEDNNLEEAREKTSLIVSRDTSELDTEEIVSASIESTCESITDGIISPFFYFIFLGVPGAVGFRVVNTLDSMFGYKNSEMKDFGWGPANLDTLLGFIPARLTAFMMVPSAWFLGEDWKEAMRCASKESGKTSSINSGWPMAAAAGALNAKLEKQDHYILGENNQPPTPDHALRAIKIMKVSTLLFTLITMGVISIPLL